MIGSERSKPARGTMTDEQRRIITSAVDRILPGAHLPSAADAHVIGFFEWLWDDPMFREGRPRFERGLQHLQTLALALHGRVFAECSAEERDEVLNRLGAIPHAIARRFLLQLVRTTLAGYLCHPRYGGNRDAIAWRALGISYQGRQEGEPA